MIGIIGIGRWGQNLLRVFNEVDNVVAVTNKSDEAAREFVKTNYPSIKIYADYKELLKDSSIKAVVIATPLIYHFEIAKQALAAGKHVFVEKPMTQTVEQARELVNLGRGLQLFVGYLFLYHPIYAELKKICADDPAVRMNMVWNKTGTFKEDIIEALACHDIALAIGLFDSIPKKAEGIMRKGIVTQTDIVKFNLEFGEKRCSIEINRVFPKENKIVQIETKSGAVYYWIDNELYKFDGRKYELIFENKEEPLKIEVQSFIDAIRNNTPVITDRVFGLKVMSAIDLYRWSLNS